MTSFNAAAIAFARSGSGEAEISACAAAVCSGRIWADSCPSAAVWNLAPNPAMTPEMIFAFAVSTSTIAREISFLTTTSRGLTVSNLAASASPSLVRPSNSALSNSTPTCWASVASTCGLNAEVTVCSRVAKAATALSPFSVAVLATVSRVLIPVPLNPAMMNVSSVCRLSATAFWIAFPTSPVFTVSMTAFRILSCTTSVSPSAPPAVRIAIPRLISGGRRSQTFAFFCKNVAAFPSASFLAALESVRVFRNPPVR